MEVTDLALLTAQVRKKGEGLQKRQKKRSKFTARTPLFGVGFLKLFLIFFKLKY